MTPKEKEDHPHYRTTNGYLKTHTYQEAWTLVPEVVINQIKKLANFDAKVFQEITGVEV